MKDSGIVPKKMAKQEKELEEVGAQMEQKFKGLEVSAENEKILLELHSGEVKEMQCTIEDV